MVNGTPNFAAARASAISPWYQQRPAAPVGAITSGSGSALPNSVVPSALSVRSTSTRLRSLMRRNASRLSASADSSSLPRSTNSKIHFGSRRFASVRRSSTL
jgi:hypothetical protein